MSAMHKQFFLIFKRFWAKVLTQKNIDCIFLCVNICFYGETFVNVSGLIYLVQLGAPCFVNTIYHFSGMRLFFLVVPCLILGVSSVPFVFINMTDQHNP